MAEAGGIPGHPVQCTPPARVLNIAPETALELSKHPLINGIKEASGNISQVAKVAALCGDALNIYSGNDDQVVPPAGKGVISVVSNVAPELVHNCCQAFLDRDTQGLRFAAGNAAAGGSVLRGEPHSGQVCHERAGLERRRMRRLPLVEPSDAHKAKDRAGSAGCRSDQGITSTAYRMPGIFSFRAFCHIIEMRKQQ